ncbi:MAG: NAD(P)-dependent oxidoreductase [Nitrospira sp.]|nr:NAD(P)-dependent oxidoreductase [Nitrospira sp.]
MKALVTGATGFIGSHLCEELVKRGYEVSCLIRETSDLRWLEGIELKCITADCTNIKLLFDAVVGFDYIFHLAGLTKALSESDFFFINAEGTENLIRAVSEKNPDLKRFLYLSTLAAVGPSKNGSPIREDAEPSPVSSYGKSKLKGERAVLQYKDSIPITILRPPAVYGPRDKDFLPFFKMIKKGIFPDWGKCYYSMLYVDDLIQGIILSAESREAEGEIYFLSDNRFYSNEELAIEISSALNAQLKITRLRIPRCIMPVVAYIGEKIQRQGIINRDKVKELNYTHWICDSQKAREEFGFTPNVGIKEGIKWTADWYRIHRWL